MTPRSAIYAARIPLRQLQLVACVVVLVVLALTGVLIKNSVAALKALQAERLTHEQVIESLPLLQALKKELSADIARQAPADTSQAVEVKLDQLLVDVLGQLNKISAQYNVALNSVTPGMESEVLTFDEIPFDIEISGSYRDVVRWLLEVEKAPLRPTVSRFEVSRHASSADVVMQLRLAVYVNKGPSK